jgi:hypothetical protein
LGHCNGDWNSWGAWLGYAGSDYLCSSLNLNFLAINMALAFCMGTDLQALYDSPQPMAQIFFHSFGRKATLGIWAIVVLVQ